MSGQQIGCALQGLSQRRATAAANRLDPVIVPCAGLAGSQSQLHAFAAKADQRDMFAALIGLVEQVEQHTLGACEAAACHHR